ERDSRVVHVVDGERTGDLHFLAEGEGACDDLFGHLVCDHRGGGDRGEPEPLLRPGAEVTLADEDRPHRVGRRPDPELEGRRLLASGGLGQPCNFRASSMQSVVHGTASSRSTGISLPQTEQVPYVPASIRARASSTWWSCSRASSSSPSSSSRP